MPRRPRCCDERSHCFQLMTSSVVVVYLPCSPTTSCVTPSRQGDKIVNVRLDLTDEKAVAKSLKDNQVEGVTHVFHTAFSGADHRVYTLFIAWGSGSHAASLCSPVCQPRTAAARCAVASNVPQDDTCTEQFRDWLWTHCAGDMTNMSLSVANMLRNIVEALEETKAPLQHVYTTLGGEYRAVVGMRTGACDDRQSLSCVHSSWQR